MIITGTSLSCTPVPPIPLNCSKYDSNSKCLVCNPNYIIDQATGCSNVFTEGCLTLNNAICIACNSLQSYKVASTDPNTRAVTCATKLACTVAKCGSNCDGSTCNRCVRG